MYQEEPCDVSGAALTLNMLKKEMMKIKNLTILDITTSYIYFKSNFTRQTKHVYLSLYRTGKICLFILLRDM